MYIWLRLEKFLIALKKILHLSWWEANSATPPQSGITYNSLVLYGKNCYG